MEKGILEGYKRNESSVYIELKNFHYWSFMHDGISKFLSELNGIYIRYLTKLRGGLNADELASHLIDEIGDILEVQGLTFETIFSEVSKYVKDKIFPIPPNYFKLGKLKKVDIKKTPLSLKPEIRFQLVIVEMG